LSEVPPQVQTREDILRDCKGYFESIVEMVEKYADRSLETAIMLTGLKNQGRAIIKQLDVQLQLQLGAATDPQQVPQVSPQTKPSAVPPQ
jgi:hypothetical protein